MKYFYKLKLPKRLLIITAALFCISAKTYSNVSAGNDTTWHDAKAFGIEGRGWNDNQMDSPFDRLPAKAKKMIREPVWNLARNSAGISFRFTTGADSFFVRWMLLSPILAMGHMPATGVSGIDVYYKKGNDWFFTGNGRPFNPVQNTSKFFKPDTNKKEIEYLVYLPLYNGVTDVQVGICSPALIKSTSKNSNENKKPIIFYGTSITQGGCASRPGNAFTSIISRRINYPVINLGFSGNGRLDMEICELISELDPSVYVIDCMRNLTYEQVMNLTEPFLRLLRKNKPTSPILLVDQTDFRMDFPNKRSAFLLTAYQKFISEGDKNIYFLEGNNLLGSDGEGTVDGAHPNDLGFMRMADVIQKKLEEILKTK